MARREEGIPTTYPIAYFLYRSTVWILFKLITRLHIAGAENVPSEGACILASNHLTMLDPPLTYAATKRWLYGFAAHKYKDRLFLGATLRIGRVIFVRRFEFDRQSLEMSLNILNREHALFVPIEGTRSKTGALGAGKDGIAYMATRTGATIIPVAIWGVENVLSSLKRLKRTDVHIVFGEPMHIPHERKRSKELQAYTDDIITTIATMLPEQYRGVYAEHPLTLEKLAGRVATG